MLATAVQGGNPPDIATLAAARARQGLRRSKGALKPITLRAADDRGELRTRLVQLGTVNGKLYGLFFKGANKSTVWYNVASFKNAGVKPPKTWPQLLKAAKTLRASGTKAYSIGGADGWTLTDLFENIYLRTAGPAKYDQLSTHKIKWTDPSVKAALKIDGADLRGHGQHRRRHVGRAADRLPDLGLAGVHGAVRRRRWCSRATSSRA